MRLIDLQRQFQAALVDPSARSPDGGEPLRFVARRGSAELTKQRQSIYQRGFSINTSRFLGGVCFNTKKYLGESAWEELARRFVAAYPPRDAVGGTLAKNLERFVRATEPYCSQPLLADLVRWEWQRSLAMNAAVELPLEEEEWRSCTGTHARRLRISLKKRTYLVRLRHPVSQLDFDQPVTAPERSAAFWLFGNVVRGKSTSWAVAGAEYRALRLLRYGTTLTGLDQLLRRELAGETERRSLQKKLIDRRLIARDG